MYWIHLKREDERGDIDLWPPAAFLPHLSCCPCAHYHPCLVGSFSSFLCSRPHHPHVRVTSCVLCSGNPAKPFQPPPPQRYCHTTSQRDPVWLELLCTHKALKYGRARYVQTNTSCRDPGNSFLIPNSATECPICLLICFSHFLNWSWNVDCHSSWKCCFVKITTDICTCDLSGSRPDFTAEIQEQEATNPQNKSLLLYHSIQQFVSCTCVILAQLITLKYFAAN